MSYTPLPPVRAVVSASLLAVASGTGAAPLPAQPPAAATSEDVVSANRALAAAFEAAWNAHDMQAFGRLLTADVDWVNVDAGRGRGRAMTVTGHERVHAGKFRESVLTVRSAEVAPVRPDVAVVHVAWGIRGDRNDDGTPRQPREGLFTWVTVREADGWKIRASHNTNRTQPR